jgi:hypothetical protein
MSETITLELPNPIIQKVKQIASLSNRTVEEVLMEWINLASQDLSVDFLSDEKVLALTNSQMPDEQQNLLGELQVRQRESQLSEAESNQLSELMQIYRQGLVRKAQALKIAVQRGLMPSLSHHS